MAAVPNSLPSRGAPNIELDGQAFRVFLSGMVSLETRLLRRPVGSLDAYRDDILRALDWLFTGI